MRAPAPPTPPRRCFGRLTYSTPALDPSLPLIGSGGERAEPSRAVSMGTTHRKHRSRGACGSFCPDFCARSSSSRIRLCSPPFYSYNCVFG